jgi:hypothetical protein
MARFFHPGKRICKQWPAEEWRRITGAVITGEGERRVGQRQQMCHLVTIPQFGEGVTFHIVKKNFQVNVGPVTVFASKVTVVNPVPPPMVDADRASVVVPNVFGGAGLCEEIDQLCNEGIEVDDNNKPFLEDAAPAPANPVGMRYKYTVPTFSLNGQTTTSLTILGGGCNTSGTRLQRNLNWISSAYASRWILSVKLSSPPPTFICSRT